jgi:dephospho-CoA kinase
MLRIGLTGGIGSGKTTIARLFADLGVPVIDADAIAHALTQPGEPTTAEILAVFGPEIGEDGRLNRARLAQRIFVDAEARKRLESILHPRIRAIMQNQMQLLHAPYVLLVIPLLLESRQHDLVDRVLVVDVDEQTQLQRVQQRDGRPVSEIQDIMQAQIGRKARLAAADDCIDNEGSLHELKSQVRKLHAKYLKLAGATPGGTTA